MRGGGGGGGDTGTFDKYYSYPLVTPPLPLLCLFYFLSPSVCYRELLRGDKTFIRALVNSPCDVGERASEWMNGGLTTKVGGWSYLFLESHLSSRKQNICRVYDRHKFFFKCHWSCLCLSFIDHHHHNLWLWNDSLWTVWTSRNSSSSPLSSIN